jgi:pyridoxamine 5'-phosphate oxidase family protein
MRPACVKGQALGMTTFTKNQRAYLSGLRLARLATVGLHGQPHVVPTSFRFKEADGTLDLGGHAMESTRKFRDAQANPSVALVIDDIASTNPWHVRGIEIRGRAGAFAEGGRGIQPGFGDAWMRVVPEKVVA